jgi:PAS domain S-box-containing protein
MEASLRKAGEELESRVQQRTAELARANTALQTEITHRKQAEAVLRESEERYRTVAETAADAIITMDEDSRILFVNPAGERIFGYSRPEMLGHQITMLMPEPLRASHLASLKRYVATGQRNIPWESIEFLGLHKSGKEIHVEISVTTFIKDGKHIFAGIFRDITERKRVEESLRESEARYRALFEGVPVGLYRSTPSGEILDANAAMAQILGYPNRETLLRPNAADFYVHPEDRARWEAQVGRAKVVKDFDVELLRLTDTLPSEQRPSRRGQEDRAPIRAALQTSLRESGQRRAARARSAQDRVAQAVVGLVTDPNGRFLQVNRAYCEITGYRGELDERLRVNYVSR